MTTLRPNHTTEPIPVFVRGMGVCCPLSTSVTTFGERIYNLESSILEADYFQNGVPLTASGFSEEQLHTIKQKVSQKHLSLFEKIAVLAIREALEQAGLKGDSDKLVFILSTTKGNIELLQNGPEAVSILASAQRLKNHFNNPNTPLVVSNACISGVLAQIAAVRLIRAGRFKQVVVIGADRLSKFVADGFNAFQALSAVRCKPFDRDRSGLNLGEGAGCLIFSDRSQAGSGQILTGTGISNDANHISGPSRTGKELGMAIQNALRESGKQAEEVDCISAHGTATRYNDEMESRAFTQAGVSRAPVHSLKAYIGHTLGAAGVLETIMGLQAMQHGKSIATPGFEHPGTSFPLQLHDTTGELEARVFLKTASGFGGCNAALIWETI